MMEAESRPLCLEPGLRAEVSAWDLELTDQDLRILHLAAEDLEGRCSVFLSEEGTLLVSGPGNGLVLPAGESLARLEVFGLLRRVPNHACVLTPQGWDVASAPEGADRWLTLHQGA